MVVFSCSCHFTLCDVFLQFISLFFNMWNISADVLILRGWWWLCESETSSLLKKKPLTLRKLRWWWMSIGAFGWVLAPEHRIRADSVAARFDEVWVCRFGQISAVVSRTWSSHDRFRQPLVPLALWVWKCFERIISYRRIHRTRLNQRIRWVCSDWTWNKSEAARFHTKWRERRH